MANQAHIDIANRIKRPVAYAEYHAYELEGGPIEARYFQDKGSILWNIVRWNTHVHLGIRDGNILVLAFRGTDFPLTVENWAKIKRWRGLCGNVLTDLSFGASSIEWEGAAALQGVLVHKGFLIAFNNLRDKLALRINTLMEQQRPRHIEVCGHSLGGALATLCALWCKTRWRDANVTCVTIGSPRVGDARFVERFRGLGICSYRVMVDSDPIPTLPNRYTETFPIRISTTRPYFRVCCTTTRYRHVGNPIWLHKNLGGFEIRDYNLPDIGNEETAADLPLIVTLGLRWGGIILYACFRALWLLWNIWAHMPTRYPTAVQIYFENALWGPPIPIPPGNGT
ncbi:hypothetical protein FOVG_16581 [Fusarium oxysporum f. sp. pisi HDV247]|uniref:Fungal lipase-type domain-containing protein n=1 Tax=Fusarium oxysporum f. sp. pisi HDV247 TaxID=1080344 RepID=W9NWS0_FUSOX|nr:hypothetical protein FOVG_16581 [Fusarium oxysporum f. sp. pisi HDV247]